MQRLNNMLPNSQWITEEIREVKKFLGTNENTTIQNVWDAAKAVLREKYTVIKDYLGK